MFMLWLVTRGRRRTFFRWRFGSSAWLIMWWPTYRKKVLPRMAAEDGSSAWSSGRTFFREKEIERRDTRRRTFFRWTCRKKVLPWILAEEGSSARVTTFNFLLAEEGSSAGSRRRTIFRCHPRNKLLPQQFVWLYFAFFFLEIYPWMNYFLFIY